MKSRRSGLFIISVLLFAFLCGCTAKLTTVRPAEISELRVERITDGVTVTLPSAKHNADLKNILIFQLEEPYGATGDCSETDGHLYKVSLYIVDKLDTEVIINKDSSVCRRGKRYVPLSKAGSPVNIEDWNALFAEDDINKADSSAEPPTQPTESPTAPAKTTDPSFIEGNLDIVACQGDAKPLPSGAEILGSTQVTDILPWSYFVSDVRYDGQNFIMVWRDTPKGDAEWICNVTQTTEDTALRHRIEYVEKSYERSGEKYLYFTILDASNFHRSLWCFDPETTYFNRVLDAPCSNMILLEYEPNKAQGIGWIVYDHYLAAVDLAFGSTNEALTINLDESIDGHPFYGIGAFGTHKFVLLSDNCNSEYGEFAVQIEVITAEPEISAPELRQTYQMDILTHNMVLLAEEG